MSSTLYMISTVLLIFFSTSLWANEGADLLENRPEGMSYYYAGAELEKNWERLHADDSISYPTASSVEQFLAPYINKEQFKAALPPNFDGNYEHLAGQVQQAWRLFHAGQYKDSYELAQQLGLAGILPKLRSLAIHHHYFVKSRKAKQKTFAALIREIEKVQKRYQLEQAPIYLLKAFAIGRYGQEISPVSAFAKGLGGKLKRNIYRAAELAPNNIEAIMFKAVFDSEAINHAGSITSKLLYGASKKRARKYFQQAMQAAPENTALLLEYGKACLYICPRKQRKQAYQTLQQLTQAPARDLGDFENKKMAKDILDHKV